MILLFLKIYLASALAAKVLVNIRIRLSSPEWRQASEERGKYMQSQTGVSNETITNAFCLFPVFNTYFALGLLRRVILLLIKSPKKQK